MKSVVKLDDLRSISKKLPNVIEDIKWENHLCFNINGKMFLLTTPDEFPVGACLKVSDEEFDELITKDGITPARYLARYKWVDVDDIGRFSKKQWEYFIFKAYELVLAKQKKPKAKKTTVKKSKTVVSKKKKSAVKFVKPKNVKKKAARKKN